MVGYFDNAAATQVDPAVLEDMLPFLKESYGNPSSIHRLGQFAANAVQEARERLARGLHCRPSEVIFTAGGTESDNLALIGVAFANRDKGKKIITTRIEHHAVLNACAHLEQNGFQVVYLPVDADGLVSPDDLREVMSPDTTLVSIMAVNNEIGTVQPIEELAHIVHQGGAIFHTDAVQAIGKVPVDVTRWQADLMSMAAHKFHGPKGVGALVVRAGTKLSPIMFGGDHERGLRPSTENVPGIVGMGKAMELTMASMDEAVPRMMELRNKIIDSALHDVTDARLNGSRTHRCCSIANLSFPGVEGESLAIMLDREGYAVSTGSACSSKAAGPSHVLRAIGLDGRQAKGSIRISLSRCTTNEEADGLVSILPDVVRRCRSLR